MIPSLILIPLFFLKTFSSLPAYNETLAKRFWFLQVASLCSRERLSQWNVSTVSENIPNVTDISIVYDENWDNLAYTAYDREENLVFMVFRRTVDFVNDIEDVDFIKEDYNHYSCEDCQVHQGFFDAYINVKDKILEAFFNLCEKYPFAKTAVLGHSLGAAMSTFAFIDVSIKTKKKQPDYFYTFGSPRIGNENFVFFVNSLNESQRARITHFQDSTPHLPLNIMGFAHISNEVFYNEDSSSFVLCTDAFSEDINCSDQFNVFEWRSHDHVNYMGFDHTTYQKTCE